MIASLNREVASLDVSIAAELQTSRVRDPRHYAYPTTAKAIDLREQKSERDDRRAVEAAGSVGPMILDTSEALVLGLQPA